MMLSAARQLWEITGKLPDVTPRGNPAERGRRKGTGTKYTREVRQFILDNRHEHRAELARKITEKFGFEPDSHYCYAIIRQETCAVSLRLRKLQRTFGHLTAEQQDQLAEHLEGWLRLIAGVRS